MKKEEKMGGEKKKEKRGGGEKKDLYLDQHFYFFPKKLRSVFSVRKVKCKTKLRI